MTGLPARGERGSAGLGLVLETSQWLLLSPMTSALPHSYPLGQHTGQGSLRLPHVLT